MVVEAWSSGFLGSVLSVISGIGLVAGDPAQCYQCAGCPSTVGGLGLPVSAVVVPIILGTGHHRFCLLRLLGGGRGEASRSHALDRICCRAPLISAPS